MPDRDEYEPLARKWKPAYDSYISLQVIPEEIADEALKLVAAMLRDCKGCTCLQQITDLLWDNQFKITQKNIFYASSQEMLSNLFRQLDHIADAVTNQRIETVAIRSARTIALQIHTQGILDTTPAAFQHHVGAQVIKDLIRHCYLDKARAFSVGTRFPSGVEALHFHSQVLTEIERKMDRLVHQFVHHQEGETLRYTSHRKKQGTSEMLYSNDFRMDII